MDRLAHQLARPLTARRVAIVGAGWAGISAAVHARLAGHEVQVFEMAAQAGGRARTVRVAGHDLDNGQHILIGAYGATLELMRVVGADPSARLLRMPLALQYPDGTGLRLPAGAPLPAFVRGVLARHGWSWADRISLLAHATRWAAMRFVCAETLTVAELCKHMPAAVHRQLVEPLCVAALNTPATSASARIFLRVLRDALFSGPGSSDLLLPAAPLGALLPQPAMAWFETQGVRVHRSTRVVQVQPDGQGWRVDGLAFEAVVLACSAAEATRLCAADRAGMGGHGRVPALRAHCHGLSALSGGGSGPADDGTRRGCRFPSAVCLRPGRAQRRGRRVRLRGQRRARLG